VGGPRPDIQQRESQGSELLDLALVREGKFNKLRRAGSTSQVKPEGIVFVSPAGQASRARPAQTIRSNVHTELWGPPHQGRARASPALMKVM